MDSEEYRAWVRTKTPRYVDLGSHRLNATLGIVGEAGEISELTKKAVFHGKGFKHDDIIEEAGDLYFYLIWFLDCFGIGIDEVVAVNVNKLNERYPDGFKPHGDQ